MLCRWLMYASLLGVLSLTVGCAQPVIPVDMHAPTGSTLSFQGKTFTLPAVVPLPRPSRIGDVDRFDVRFAFPGPDHQPIAASGVLKTFGYNETDLDRLSENPLDITDSQIGQLLDGYAIEFNGRSASNQLIYHLTIGKQK